MSLESLRENIGIGIITALPKEYAAMRGMLENSREYPVYGYRNTTRYLIGQIPTANGKYHAVVLSLLPVMGNNSASGRATLLLEHFPFVRSIIMVGIAGGAPNPSKVDEHVRLGDIVVSNQQGVVQYDYQKETIAEIQIRSPPRPPSAELLEAVRLLEADEIRGYKPWLQYIELANGLRFSSRPPDETDILEATPPQKGRISHPVDAVREPGVPRVFCGSIGSANNLLKNAETRDAIRDKFGARAFEMEGSGIADASWAQTVGYLVIRGICDYCDAQKNDDWQGYAAVVAAAYTRALIGSMPIPAPEKGKTGTPDIGSNDAVSLPVKSHSFLNQVAEMYRLLHYRVETNKFFTGCNVDLFLTGQHGDMEIFRAVECHATEITPDYVSKVSSKIRLVQREFPTASGTIVSGASFSKETLHQSKLEGIRCIATMELSAQLFDGVPYANKLIQDIELDSKYSLSSYIQPSVGLENIDSGHPATEVIQQWLDDPAWNQITLLGDVGTGKTFLSKALAHRLASSYLEAPLESPLPVLIDLRNADRWLSLEGLILTHLHQNGMPRATFDIFQHVLTNGRLILILDGFDEMAARVTPQITTRNFQELIKCVRGRAKVMLTCRTHYFKNRSDEEQVILDAPMKYESEAARQLYWDLVVRKGFQIAYLRPFETWQVEEYVKRVKGKASKAALEKIRNIYNLMELSKRPMLLDIIVKSIDKLHENTNAADLYQVFTDIWINRDKWRDVLAPEQKLTLLRQLAWQLWTTGKTKIHYSELFLHLGKTSEYQDPGEMVDLDHEIRTASFLVRDAEGNYSFAHKSYAEFFLARYLYSEILEDRIECLDHGRISPEELSFLCDLIRETELLTIKDKLMVAISSAYRPRFSENVLICLRAILLRSKALKTPVKLSMPSAQLENTNLEGLSAPGADLSRACLSGSVLTHVDFRDANLVGADLRGVDLRNAELSGACFIGVNLTAANLEGANIEYADFTEATIEHAMFANTRNDHAKFDLAKSSGADFGGNRPSSLPSEVDFRQMVRRLYPLIEREVRMIWKQSFLQHERDDIVSEVALGLYSMLMMGKLQHSLREDDIRRLIRKLALDQYRRMEREARYGDIDPSVFVNFNIIPDDKPNPEEQTMDKELSVQLNDYINTNFDAAARALLLDWVSGNSSLELAKKYNISQASAHQRVNRMLTRLRSVSAGQM